MALPVAFKKLGVEKAKTEVSVAPAVPAALVAPRPKPQAIPPAPQVQNSVAPKASLPIREKAVVFSKPNQVAEIMKEVDRLKLQVLLRYSRNGKAVRAVFYGYLPAKGEVTLSGISAAGEKLLARSIALKIEFILLSKKIVFVSEVVSRSSGKVTVKVPDKVVAIERRINVRFKVPSSSPAFIEFPDRKVDFSDEGAPFIPVSLLGATRNSAFLRIDDVSLGGVAGFTRYIAVSNAMKAGDENQNAILYFPDSYPVSLQVSIRWCKKTTVTDADNKFEEFRNYIAKVAGTDSADFEVKESFYRIGVQFPEVSKDLDSLLRTFIRKVQQAESV